MAFIHSPVETTMSLELTLDVFTAWARAVGLTASPERLAKLRPDVEAMLGRIASLDDLPVDHIPVESAVGGVE